MDAENIGYFAWSFILLGASVLTGCWVMRAIKTGHMSVRGARFDRSENPFLFYVLLTLNLVVSLWAYLEKMDTNLGGFVFV